MCCLSRKKKIEEGNTDPKSSSAGSVFSGKAGWNIEQKQDGYGLEIGKSEEVLPF